MSKDPYSNLQSSLPLEDFLAQQPSRISQNWLLTYLDVFVLIVMLVITIITVSDLNTQQAVANKPRTVIAKKMVPVICPPVPTPVEVVCPPVVAEHKPDITPIEQKVEIKPESTDLKESSVAPINTQIATENHPTPVDNKLVAVGITDENQLQQQLEKTINEFGLNEIVTIKVTQGGYAQLEIQDKVLFKSSEADLTASGGVLLKRLIPVLKQAVGLILIEGHTDNVPIKTAQFRSNWELGSSRATSVLHFLVLQQIDGSRLRAITYADTMPIADNSTAEGREKNRRVNILIRFSGQ